MARWLNSPFPLSPFSLFAFSPFYRFVLSSCLLLTCLSAAGPLPPRLPGRGRPPPRSDCTLWPLGRRGRSSCRGTLRSSAPPSTAGGQDRGSGLGARDLTIDDCRLTIAQNRDSGLGARDLTIDDCRLMIASRDPYLSPVTCPLFPVWVLAPGFWLLTSAFWLLPSAFGLRPSASPPSPSSAPPGIWPTAADR